MQSDLKPSDPKPSDLNSAEKRRHPAAPSIQPQVDELLDEALEDTFPASDPVSLTQPAKVRAATRGTRKAAD